MSDRSLMWVRINTTATAVTLALILCGGCSGRWGDDIDPSAVACQGYGFYPETPQYDACIKYVASQRAKRAAMTPQPAQQAPNIVCRTTSSGTDCQAR